MDLDKLDTVKNIQDLIAIRDDIEKLGQLQSQKNILMPKIDLLDLGDSYRLVMEIPGVPQENLEVALQGQSLTIAGLRETRPEGVEVLLSERPSGHFQRTVDLPGEIDREACQAHVRSGLLVLSLPKA